MIRKIIQWSLLSVESVDTVIQILRFKSTEFIGDMSVRQCGKLSKEIMNPCSHPRRSKIYSWKLNFSSLTMLVISVPIETFCCTKTQ
jgi:hypothetical protein